MESHAGSTTTSAPAGGWAFAASGSVGESASKSRDEAAAQLRARLLRLIVANETARNTSDADASKPR